MLKLEKFKNSFFLGREKCQVNSTFFLGKIGTARKTREFFNFCRLVIKFVLVGWVVLKTSFGIFILNLTNVQPLC